MFWPQSSTNIACNDSWKSFHPQRVLGHNSWSCYHTLADMTYGSATNYPRTRLLKVLPPTLTNVNSLQADNYRPSFYYSTATIPATWRCIDDRWHVVGNLGILRVPEVYWAAIIELSISRKQCPDCVVANNLYMHLKININCDGISNLTGF